MQSIVREVIVGHLMELSDMVDLYEDRDPRFVAAAIKWMTSVEEALGRLRLPLTSYVAAGRGTILAAQDGYRLPGYEGVSPRRALRGAASSVLADLEREMRATVASIDEMLIEMTDRMAQLIALATQQVALPPPTEPREQWLEQVWDALDVANGAAPIRAYLQARMTRTDRLYVLDSVMRNVDKPA